MIKSIDPSRQKRFSIAVLMIVVLAVLFWTGSRYPALDEKAMMSGAIQLEDPLSFDAVVPIDAAMSTVEKIGYSTLNWLNTNKKGMTFGVLFAATFLTLMGYVTQRGFRGGFANAALGLVIGTPLGVCVNCAAPIARGMHAGGLRAETTLAAMIASPTLNVVVLTLAISLLPFYLVVVKIAVSLFIILIAVPLVARLLPDETRAPSPDVPAPQGWSAQELGQPSIEGLGLAVAGVIRDFGRNLWFILRMTVPLMFLAGFLGAVAITLLPGEMITTLPYGFLALVVIAAVGLFLPVPIAFDVVVVGVLLAAGLSHGYAMALLITLGSFSVYSWFIVTQSMGLRAANLMAGAVLISGIVAGAAVQGWHSYQSRKALELLTGEAPLTQPFMAAAASEADGSLVVTATPFAPRSASADTPFVRLEATKIGIDKPVEFSMRDMWPPFWEGRSLSSGDIDNDGDLDLVIASTEVGLYVYANDGAGQFSRVDVAGGPLDEMPVFNAVLVDVDNDGWRELVVATYRRGMFVIENDAGQLRTAEPAPLQTRADAVLALALSFGDPDQDGDLDVALGNWAAGWYRRIPGEESRNRILWNDDGVLTGARFTDLPGIPGETLSILFADINADGNADLLVGNDFEIPDYYYLGDGHGGFDAITFQDGLVEHVPTTTMGIKVADLMNDGVPEVYAVQIAGRSSGVSDRLKMQPLAQYCDAIEQADARATCQENMAIKRWYKSGNNFNPSYASKCQTLLGRQAAECKAMLIKDLAIQKRDPKVCRLIPADQWVAQSYCELHFAPPRKITSAEADAALPQIKRANVLLESETAGGPLMDSAAARGLEVGGWSWDTKVADFDNDGFQDVYIVNGTWVPNEVSPSNLFFHNKGDGTFSEASGAFGLEDYLMTAAATAFDMDGDGDLDIISQPVNGPVIAFVNAGQTGNAVVLGLSDMRGNRDGIGALVTVTDDLGVIRTREVQLGGGFMSFDAPEVHVGLGQASRIVSGKVRWADGVETPLPQALEAGNRYQVSRQ
ncbi:FG-GAP repeat protein [Shimia sp. SK013]|uniref:FG-GAP-like repeat-containing protein n=1 Tax=Shimia sp. SK013 TaxID=1389006 RepID=UPI0006B5037A|nr:FG-GAP-like repeat-containing protein [Shimia sp. SK013]KPA19788.1 FG-GAP repeat protein [Shimia sp. SK013]